MDKIINNTNNLNIIIDNTNLELFIDGVLSYELKSHDKLMPIYSIVLNFMFETGGIY